MNLFGFRSANLTVFTQVTRRLTAHLELAMVLDNTTSMDEPAGGGGGVTKIQALKTASHTLIDILFGSAPTLPNLHISIVPYNNSVNIGNTPEHLLWMQQGFNTTNFHGSVGNRNNDCPSNGLNDATDDLPTTEQLRFRVPFHANGTPGCPQGDLGEWPVRPLVPLLNDKQALHGIIDSFYTRPWTRINVGLMWGWFTISERWHGMWDDPTLPEHPNSRLTKAIILMTDGQNTVFGTDDNTTAALCSEIKSRGILLYTVGLGTGNQLNGPLLQACATQPHAPYFFLTPTSQDLQTAFETIAGDLLFSSIRLSE
jgi:hypothetical protein